MKSPLSLRLRILIAIAAASASIGITTGITTAHEYCDSDSHSIGFMLPAVPDTIMVDGQRTIVYYHSQLDESAEYPGGMQEIMLFLSKNLTYPQTCFSAEGRTITKILIDSEGVVRQAETVQSLWQPLDEEVIRVSHLMPRFRPAVLNGDSVASWFLLPVTFREKKQ